MNKPKVFITRKWSASVEEQLIARYNVSLNKDDKPLKADVLNMPYKNAQCSIPDKI